MKQHRSEAKKGWGLMRLLVALAVLTLLAAVNYSPQLLAQGAAFLSVPYYGSRTVNSFFDNEYPDYVINDRIVMYDGSVARRSHGTCGGSSMAYFSQPYGQGKCIWYDGHSGYDFALVNEKVLASADGQIYQARWWDWNNRNAALGLFIDINHDGGYVTRYAHLSAALVSANTNVIKGEIIGVSGNTGNSSGPHLHFEVRQNNNPVDPFENPSLWEGGEWRADQWFGYAEPRYGGSLVVDDDNPQQVGGPDDDPNFAKGLVSNGANLSCPPATCADWYRVTNLGQNADMLWTNTASSIQRWARWSPPVAGLFDVRVFVPHDHATTWAARYCLINSYNYMPSSCMVVDQSGLGDVWLSLGVHHLGIYPSAPWYGIWVDNWTGETQAGRNKLGVDAIQFRMPNPLYLPYVVK